MASKDGGGGGAFGWTLLGFLAGVAATLALQILFGGGHEQTPPPEAEAAHATIIQAEAPPPRSPVHTAKAESSGQPASVASVAAEPRDEVADDAAAAGMTSRVQPQPDNGGSRN